MVVKDASIKSPEPFDMNPVTSPDRLRHAQIICCDGGCCGRPDRAGTAVVPLQRLRAAWKARDIRPGISLAVSSCLGPCDVANVVCIVHDRGSFWLGRLADADYDVLADWAASCRDGLRRLPSRLESLRFVRWRHHREADGGSPALDDR